MKSRIAIAALLAALVVPAVSLAGAPTAQDRANAARACRALRAQMGVALFKQSYGTVQSNRANAFGRCVSQWAHTEQQNRVGAQAACRAEQIDPDFAATHDGKTFAEFYGVGPKHRNAFGRCVSSKARAASLERRAAVMNAARQCKSERADLGGAAFRAKYGRNASDRNAFGKCVSLLARPTN
jgi:hypothetical protein